MNTVSYFTKSFWYKRNADGTIEKIEISEMNVGNLMLETDDDPLDGCFPFVVEASFSTMTRDDDTGNVWKSDYVWLEFFCEKKKDVSDGVS